MIELSKVGYKDVIDDMLLQRSQMHNTYDANQTVEETLYHFKDSYIYLNRDIRKTIGKNIGQADFVIEPTGQMIGLDNLIKQSIIPRDITLWRIATPYDFALREMDTETFWKTFYKRDEMFQIPIYPETSLDFAFPKDIAKRVYREKNKSIIFKYNVKGGTEGVYMERFSNRNWMNNSEEEILLGRNLIGKFKSRTSFNNYELIEVDIIPDANVGKNTVHKFWEEAPIEQRWGD
ncbi:MAG: hypothetical protein MJ231_06750 [bacterium]|nr:hypothetical protein [bacterium]